MVESKEKTQLNMDEIKKEVISTLENNLLYNKDLLDMNFALIGDEDSMIETFKDFVDDKNFAEKLYNIILFLDDTNRIPESYYNSREFYRMFCMYFIPICLSKSGSEYLKIHSKEMWKELLSVKLKEEEKLEFKNSDRVIKVLQAIFTMITIINYILKLIIFSQVLVKEKFVLKDKDHSADDLIYEELLFLMRTIKEQLITNMPDYHENRVVFKTFTDILKQIDKNLYESTSILTNNELKDYFIPELTYVENLNPFNLFDIDTEEENNIPNEEDEDEDPDHSLKNLSKKIKFDSKLDLNKAIEILSEIDIKQLIIDNSFNFSSKKELEDFEDYDESNLSRSEGSCCS